MARDVANSGGELLGGNRRLNRRLRDFDLRWTGERRLHKHGPMVRLVVDRRAKAMRRRRRASRLVRTVRFQRFNREQPVPRPAEKGLEFSFLENAGTKLVEFLRRGTEGLDIDH